MTDRRKVVWIAPLAITLLAAPGAASGAPQAVNGSDDPRPTSTPRSFWYGEDIPPFDAVLIHSALTSPNGGPIRQLMTRLENENLNPARDSGVQPGHDVSHAWPGYTLVSSLGARLIDMNGASTMASSPGA